MTALAAESFGDFGAWATGVTGAAGAVTYGAKDALNLVGAFAVFIAVCVAAYFATRWLTGAARGGRGGSGGRGGRGGKNPLKGGRGGNLELLETKAVGNGCYAHILRAGGKFFVVGVAKENVSVLGELTADDLDIEVNGDAVDLVAPFTGVFSKLFDRARGKGGETDSDKSGESDV